MALFLGLCVHVGTYKIIKITVYVGHVSMNSKVKLTELILEEEAQAAFFPFSQHALEFISVNALVWPFLKRILATKPGLTATFPSKPPTPLSFFEKSATIALLFFELLQAFYKSLRGVKFLLNLLYPCHIVTNLLLYSLFMRHRNYKRACTIFNTLLFYSHFSGLALLFPDTSDVVWPFQEVAFWGHHIVLFVLPYILLVNERF
eukprot:Colp12_sorted_trinity150504_noHs@31214